VGLLAVLVGYPLGFGPACWVVDKSPPLIDNGICKLYRPLAELAIRQDSPLGRTLWWWSKCFRDNGAFVFYIRHVHT